MLLHRHANTVKVSSCLNPVRDIDILCFGHFRSPFSCTTTLLSRYYGNISASSAPHRELGLEMSSPVAGDMSSSLLVLDVGHLFPSCHFPPVIFLFWSMSANIDVSGRFVSPSLSCRVRALPVFIPVSQLSLTQPGSPLAPCHPVSLSAVASQSLMFEV